MRDKLKNIVGYIFRGWDKEPGYRYSRLKILPPFFFDLLGWVTATAILYKVVEFFLWGSN